LYCASYLKLWMDLHTLAIRGLQIVRDRLADSSFLERHRASPKDFTRRRKLPFSSVVLLVLQKSLKSIQLHLHEFFARLADGLAGDAASAGGWTQARAKLRHSAFIELNAAAVLAPLEAAPGALQHWRGHRLLAIDGSVLRLPNQDAIWEHFGGQEPVNQSGPCGARVPQARLSVLYDVLNRLGLETQLGGFSTGETELAAAHGGALRAGDVVLIDRGYAGYECFARLAGRGAHFVGRCPRRSFAVVAELFDRDEAGVSRTVMLKAPRSALAAGLPGTLRVRFLTLRLATGELEVLATSLLDEARHPGEDFLWLYGRRWGIETYYGVLKGRLDLENFSGQTVEAILQDVHAAVFLSNLESLLSARVAQSLPTAGEGGRRHAARINRAVSFHAIKSQMFELLLGTAPVEEVLAHLEKLFAANPVSVRPARRPVRRTPTPLRSHHFFKRVRKVVY
jgi:hypothetical protein